MCAEPFRHLRRSPAPVAARQPVQAAELKARVGDGQAHRPGRACFGQLSSREFDVLVGINVLREGFDLPEAALTGRA